MIMKYTGAFKMTPKKLLDLSLGERRAHFRDAVGGLLAHERLLHGGEALEDDEDEVGVLLSSDVLDKALP